MKTINCHRKYPITTNFLDTMLEHSIDIKEGESKLDAYRRGLKELDQIAAALRKEANQESGDPTYTVAGRPPVIHAEPAKPEEIINLKDIRLKDEIEDRILAAESPDELQSIKDKYVIMPASCLTQYNKRLAELSSGRPENFTEGLE